ncbi:MAG TPA: DNA helicase II [Desulfobulbaceae bacterium]|nr:DNA helicase II [Desulfobulbaceae bacterium]
MRYIADLHIHSCYSRATSKASRLPGLAAWAAIKGIQVLGTGDFTHPGWLQHLSEHLEPAEPGFFKLSTWNKDEVTTLVPQGIRVSDLPIGDIRFILSSEISSIYKKDGKVRKIHNILYAPDFDSVRRINKTLAKIGNLESDGRPILGLDARNLLEIFLEQGPGGFFVPAHIWTPWFSLFGSKSGFDALEECFSDLSSEIFALETGLSSDPDMNRCISAFDGYTLISNSDCHSPAKLGREANIFDTDFSFSALQQALRSPTNESGRQTFTGTIEFYPEEGKYHCDGHRKCQTCFNPEETLKRNGLCPVCGKPVTVGVLHRVMEFADRKSPVYPENAPAVYSLIPLPEILSELHGVGPGSKTVLRSYAQLINLFGSEFNLALHVPLTDISTTGSPLLGQAIDRVRQGRVIRQPGYDGEFGVIRVFEEDELSRLAGQLNLFGEPVKRKVIRKKQKNLNQQKSIHRKKKSRATQKQLNPEQLAAVTSSAPYILVQAGPGTGKTHTLVSRLNYQLQHRPGPATVITFTNKAAEEIRDRIQKIQKIQKDRDQRNKAESDGESVFVATLHSFCLYFLRRQDPLLRVVGPEMRALYLRRLFPFLSASQLTGISEGISSFLLDISQPIEGSAGDFIEGKKYFQFLDNHHLIDLEAIIPCGQALLKKNSSVGQTMRRGIGNLYIDEFQDLNKVQYLLVRELADSCSIFAIGDPDQAIYGFRGASPKWFYQFIQDLDPEVHRLTKNYRCDKNIVKAAATVIAENNDAGPAAIPVSENKGRIFKQKFKSSYGEARFIAEHIEELLGGTSHREIEKLISTSEQQNYSLRDIGVLYRTSRQADVIADVLFKQGIPYQRVELDPFYEKEPVKILYLWILVAAGTFDLSHLLSLLVIERGIGKITLNQVENALLEESDLLAALTTLSLHVEKLKIPVQRFQGFARQIRHIANEHGVAASLEPVIDHYQISRKSVDVQRFLRLSGAIGNSLTEFADYLQVNNRSVFYDNQAEAVTLMTLHAAKGVEFSAVFLIGLEEGLLPIKPREQLNRDDFLSHIEEERRLFFVGMTRARHQLYLSWSDSERRPGKLGQGKPSRFLDAIPESLLMQALPARAKRTRYKQLILFQ